MQLISLNGLHQLHIFIFFLAVLHVVFSGITMTLGRLKVSTSVIFDAHSYKIDAKILDESDLTEPSITTNLGIFVILF